MSSQSQSAAFAIDKMVIQRANGPTEVVSYEGLATGQYSVSLEIFGSQYVPAASWNIGFSGAGAGGGNPRGGGGGFPQVPLGIGSGSSFTSQTAPGNETSGAGPWTVAILLYCPLVESIAHAMATLDCSLSGGMSHYETNSCGVAKYDCYQRPPPPPPASQNPGALSFGPFTIQQPLGPLNLFWLGY
ncbi:MAG: hypothetical protein KF903_11705 [Dokdonella sp.]|uniref:hypothetical protein n=1 Tax=Dokdonella sp. TaxID=2291710 RepID=UPI0025BD6F8E|nr:hypothetical protein [Dokdonella sp.]MBX3701646.1 hypothetical protein [Dokdonella sp.]MCW5578921.1 hypothetical protein [Dokdonella sp.]